MNKEYRVRCTGCGWHKYTEFPNSAWLSAPEHCPRCFLLNGNWGDNFEIVLMKSRSVRTDAPWWKFWDRWETVWEEA